MLEESVNWNHDAWTINPGLNDLTECAEDIFGYREAMKTTAGKDMWLSIIDHALALAIPWEKPRDYVGDDDVPEWAHFEQDPKWWLSVLNAVGCDETAQQELFLLAQHDENGYKAANHLMSKLLKKKTDNEMPRNVSAFVHKCVLNARYKLQE